MPLYRFNVTQRIVRNAGLTAWLMLFATIAQAANTHIEQVDYWHSDSNATPERAPTFDEASSKTSTMLSLPHVSRAKLASDEGSSAWITHWYRFTWRPNSTDPAALYIPRVRWPRLDGRFDIYFNGKHVDNADLVWNSPVLLRIPSSASAGPVEIVFALSAPASQSTAISTVRIGDANALRSRYSWRVLLQQRMPQLTGVAFMLLGVFTFAFWQQRRQETAYLLFTLLALVNFVRTLHYYFADPAMLGDLFWWMTINSLGWLMIVAHLFAFRLHGQRFAKTERVLIGAVALVSAASLIAVLTGISIEIWGPFTYLVQIPVGIVVPALTTVGAWRTRDTTAMLLATALWINVALGVHDFLLQNWRINPESVILLPYGAIILLALFLWHISRRYLHAINDAEQLNASLEQRLAERSRELELSHQKLRSFEQEQAVAGERQRLMREMHDGLGSSLMSSLVMVEQGKLDNAQVATVLRESIDDLKLTIDSLEPMGDDLLTLLGTLRYRLGKRLETAGIQLEWHVQETPPLPWLNPTASLQILRILQEALTNTLKHAQASVIRVETGIAGEEVYIRLIDDGHGFDVSLTKTEVRGRGLQNLHRRATSIDGSIQLQSQPGRTEVTLHIPIERRGAPR
jgi:signal transduction histidine kinase